MAPISTKSHAKLGVYQDSAEIALLLQSRIAPAVGGHVSDPWKLETRDFFELTHEAGLHDCGLIEEMIHAPTRTGMQNPGLSGGPAGLAGVASHPCQRRAIDERTVEGDVESANQSEHHRPARRHLRLASAGAECTVRLDEIRSLGRRQSADEAVERTKVPPLLILESPLIRVEGQAGYPGARLDLQVARKRSRHGAHTWYADPTLAGVDCDARTILIDGDDLPLPARQSPLLLQLVDQGQETGVPCGEVLGSMVEVEPDFPSGRDPSCGTTALVEDHDVVSSVSEMSGSRETGYPTAQHSNSCHLVLLVQPAGSRCDCRKV